MELEEIEVKNIPVGKVRLSATSLRQELGDLSELVSSIREDQKGKEGNHRTISSQTINTRTKSHL